MKNHPRAGYSLLEVAIVLVILGIVMGAAMPSLIRYRQQAAVRETKERQETVAHSVAAFALLRDLLPCPADPAAQGEMKGKSRINCSSAQLAVGIVPYATLGLSEMQAKDGFNRYMSYAVPGGGHTVPRLNNDQNHPICRLQTNPKLTLRDQNGVRYASNAQAQEDYVALILISHGPSGHGAYLPGGQRLMPEGSSEPERNNGANLIFYDLPYSMGDQPFRHTVKWVTRNNLMAIYGHTPCKHQAPQGPHGQLGHNPFGAN